MKGSRFIIHFIQDFFLRLSGCKEQWGNAETVLNFPHSSTWTNLGFWRDSEVSYGDAAAALALICGNAGQLHGRIADIGFGCGDQLLLWEKHFSISSIVGFNPSAFQFSHACKLKKQHAKKKWELFSSNHKGLATFSQRSFDAVVVVDAIYFFSDKERFLREVQDKLKLGGKIGFSDFIMDINYSSRLQGLFWKFLLWSIGLKGPFWQSEQQLTSALKTARFDKATISDISSHVLTPFSHFAKRFCQQNFQQFPKHFFPKFQITAWLLEKAKKDINLRYVVVSAERV